MRRALVLVAVGFAWFCAPPPRALEPSRGAASQPATSASAPPAPSEPAASVRLANVYDAVVDTGAVQLHIQCAGTRQPTVVFEAGLGLDARSWHKVLPEVAKQTRACAYDRAGRGQSGPAPYPHDQPQMAKELYALLQKADEPGPYVLVGHSLGAAVVRWFLEEYPDRVAGMVLVDAATEDWPTRVLARIPQQEVSKFWQDARAWEGLDPEATIAGYEALRDASATLGERPLVILTPENPPSDFEPRREMQARLTRLSSNSVHLVVQDSAHEVQLEKPAVVIGSVRAVIDAVRTDTRVVDNALFPPTNLDGSGVTNR